jgi:hypothetical protein
MLFLHAEHKNTRYIDLKPISPPCVWSNKWDLSCNLLTLQSHHLQLSTHLTYKLPFKETN